MLFAGGITWENLKSTERLTLPQISDFKYSIGIGLVILVFRILVESFVFLPIGYACGWIESRKHKSLFVKCCEHMTGGFAGKTKFKKVAETAWRFSYFSFAVGLGYWAINDSEHLYDIIQCWTNWPYQHINDKVWTYYMIEIGFYWALLFSQIFFDIKRSDFWQMILHHGITIFLLFISFSINFVRVGTLVLISHDFTDIFIEFAKLIRYAGWNTTLEYFFVIFMIVWIGTRLVYYPFWIIYSVVFDAPALIEKTYSWTNITQSPIVPRILLGMLLGLLVLHIFWTILLVNIAIKSIKGGELGDAREEGDSDSDVELESSSSTDSETEKSKKNK